MQVVTTTWRERRRSPIAVPLGRTPPRRPRSRGPPPARPTTRRHRSCRARSPGRRRGPGPAVRSGKRRGRPGTLQPRPRERWDHHCPQWLKSPHPARESVPKRTPAEDPGGRRQQRQHRELAGVTFDPQRGRQQGTSHQQCGHQHGPTSPGLRDVGSVVSVSGRQQSRPAHTQLSSAHTRPPHPRLPRSIGECPGHRFLEAHGFVTEQSPDPVVVDDHLVRHRVDQRGERCGGRRR